MLHSIAAEPNGRCISCGKDGSAPYTSRKLTRSKSLQDGNGSLDPLTASRLLMVEEQIVRRGVRDARVLDAMRKVERHLFVPVDQRGSAYADSALPIGCSQTISQPYIVALMTEALALTGREKVLEVGTGCGYQTAILAELAAEVFSIEIVPELANESRALLAELGYENVNLRVGDGARGWPEAAPYDAILVAAAPRHVPPSLLEELADGGRLVIPVGEENQILELHTREGDTFPSKSLGAVRFVPLI